MLFLHTACSLNVVEMEGVGGYTCLWACRNRWLMLANVATHIDLLQAQVLRGGDCYIAS